MTEKPAALSEMYILQRPDGFWELRQERYRAYLKNGKEHPHDVCAIARSYGELRSMCAQHWPDAFKETLASDPRMTPSDWGALHKIARGEV